MPKMLNDGGVEYDDGTPATEAQQAKVRLGRACCVCASERARARVCVHCIWCIWWIGGGWAATMRETGLARCSLRTRVLPQHTSTHPTPPHPPLAARTW